MIFLSIINHSYMSRTCYGNAKKTSSIRYYEFLEVKYKNHNGSERVRVLEVRNDGRTISPYIMASISDTIDDLGVLLEIKGTTNV